MEAATDRWACEPVGQGKAASKLLGELAVVRTRQISENPSSP